MKDVLKWIGLLPIAAISSIIAFALGSLIGYISTRMFVFGGDGRWIWFITKLAADIFAGCVFVYVGTMIAPKYKQQTSVVLVAIVLVMATVGITLEIIYHTANGFWSQVEIYLGSVLTFIGSIVGYEYVKAEISNTN